MQRVWGVVVVWWTQDPLEPRRPTRRRLLAAACWSWKKAEFPQSKICEGGIIGPSRDGPPHGFELSLQDRAHLVTFSEDVPVENRIVHGLCQVMGVSPVARFARVEIIAMRIMLSECAGLVS